MTKRHDPPSSPTPYSAFPAPYVVYREEETIDLAVYWRLIADQRVWVGIIAVAATLTATAMAFALSPVYRAEVLLVPVEQEKGEGLGALTGQFGDLAAIAGINFGSTRDKTAEFVAALKSRVLSISFIKEQNLMPILFENKWDGEKKAWKEGVEPPTEWQAYGQWDGAIRHIGLDRRSGLITLGIEWRDPILAAKWANDLVQKVNSQLRADAVEEASRNIAYLEKQLPQTNSVEVQQAIYRLIEAQTKKKMIANTRAEYAFTVIDPAVPPEGKYRPNRSMTILIGLLAGLVLGSLVAIVIGRRKSAQAGEESLINPV
jgi:uncharacterized protein involved in exopolysaccharide biosynthesis